MSPEDWQEYVDDLVANVGYNVRRLRQARGLTQAELAAKAGVHLQTIRGVERGAGTTVSTLLRLVAALEVRAPEMFFQPPEFAAVPTFDQG